MTLNLGYKNTNKVHHHSNGHISKKDFLAGCELKKHSFVARKKQNGTKLNWEILMTIHTGKHRESRTAMREDTTHN